MRQYSMTMHIKKYARTIHLIVLGITLFSLSFYSAHFHPWIGLNDCLQNPQKYDGQLVTSYNEPMIGEIYSDGFQLIQKQVPSIRVYSDTTDLSTGEYVGIRAVFHREGYLVATNLKVARNRRSKIWLSVIPVLIICSFLMYYYRFNMKTFQIELRKHA
jgi:hypothetical protein